MKFFIIIFNFLFFYQANIFASSYFDVPYEEGAETIGTSYPQSIRFSFVTEQDLTGFLKSKGIENISISLRGSKINIASSDFTRTNRTSISDNFNIFSLFDNKCSFEMRISSFSFAGGLYKQHKSPSEVKVYDLSNPLEAIRLEFKLENEELRVQPLLKYVRGNELNLQWRGPEVQNPFPSWYESFNFYGKDLGHMSHYGSDKTYFYEKLLRLGYEKEARAGLFEVVWDDNVYLHQRMKVADTLYNAFPQEYSSLKQDIMLRALADVSLPLSYRTETALEYTKTHPVNGVEYLKQFWTTEGVRFFDQVVMAEELVKLEEGAYVKTMFESMLTVDSVSSTEKIDIIKLLVRLGLIN